MNQFNNHGTSLPHHRLFAYKKSLELLAAVRSAQKALPYAIARGECVAAVAATEIAGEAGDAVATPMNVSMTSKSQAAQALFPHRPT